MKFNQIVLGTLLSTSVMVLVASGAIAEEHIIEMRNKGDNGDLMTFQPSFLKIAPGDTVKFVPTDKNHNSESVNEAWPEGVPQVKGKLSNEVTFTTDKEGLYVFKCLPHYGMGMVALIQVGKPANAAALQDFKAMGLSDKRLKALLTKVEQ